MLNSVFCQMLRLPRSSSAHRPNDAAFNASLPAQLPRVMGRTLGLVLTVGLIATGCATAPERTADLEPDTSKNASPEAVETPKQPQVPVAPEELPKDPPVSAQPDSAQVPDKQPEAAGETTTVSVYTMDDQCLDFVSEPVQVSSEQAVAEAVGKAMGEMDYNAFKLEGYEVSVNGGTAIVDMRLASGSERQFVSLSSCEQQSLFGSIEQTLLNNPNLNVESVKFTDSGKELIL